MRNVPFVSILIVNFNGRHLLDECLSSLRNLTYPKKSYEVIVVDNSSSDDSIPFILKNFPEIKVVKSEENGGFTGGNILGFKQAKGEYIVLLNSDVRVDKEWLSSLVNTASDSKVGIVSSRLRFALPFIELKIDSEAVPRSKVFNTIDHSPIGVLIEDVVCEPEIYSPLVYYKSGFYDKKEGEICTRRTNGVSTILLPFDPQKKINVYTLTLHGLESLEAMSIPVVLSIDGRKVCATSLRSHETEQVVLQVKQSQVKDSFHWLIQNAGNIILSNGYGKDRGNVVVMRDNERREFYEEESSYFEQKADLLAACGASCLIKRKVIDHVGFLDGHYFMYYEDVELSMRAWRAGWKIVYDPGSIGYHKHRATTGTDESAFFLSQVERNHLAFVVSHFPFLTVIQELFLFHLRFGLTFIKYFIFQFKDNELRAMIWRRKFEGRKMAYRFVLQSLFRLFKSRYAFNTYWPINYKEMKKMLY